MIIIRVQGDANHNTNHVEKIHGSESSNPNDKHSTCTDTFTELHLYVHQKLC